MSNIWEFNSRKFRVMLYDAIISIVIYFAGKYAAPAVAEDINFLILAIQPIAVAVVAGIAYEDGTANLARKQEQPDTMIVNQPEMQKP